jgi:hypothetical protein
MRAGRFEYTYGKATLTNIKASQMIMRVCRSIQECFLLSCCDHAANFRKRIHGILYGGNQRQYHVTNVSANWNTSSGMVLINNLRGSFLKGVTARSP